MYKCSQDCHFERRCGGLSKDRHRVAGKECKGRRARSKVWFMESYGVNTRTGVDPLKSSQKREITQNVQSVCWKTECKNQALKYLVRNCLNLII